MNADRGNRLGVNESARNSVPTTSPGQEKVLASLDATPSARLDWPSSCDFVVTDMGAPTAPAQRCSNARCVPATVPVGLWSDDGTSRFWHLRDCVSRIKRPIRAAQGGAMHISRINLGIVLLTPIVFTSTAWAQRSGQSIQIQHGTVVEAKSVDLDAQAGQGAAMGGLAGYAISSGRSSST